MYPHHIFEVGKTARRDEDDVTGTTTVTSLGFLSADRDAGFNLANSHVSAILFYVGREYVLREAQDSRFIPGRAAEIVAAPAGKKGKETVLGVFGEVHPRVLEAWGVPVPCTTGEIDLERLLAHRAGGTERK